MTKKIHIGWMALLTLLAGSACTPVAQPLGVVTLDFSTIQPQTRATTPGDGDPVDGGGIVEISSGVPDLRIWIVNNDGDVVATYPGPRGQVISGSVSSTKASIQFNGTGTGETPIPWTPGATFTVYAFANTAPSGGNLSDFVLPSEGHPGQYEPADLDAISTANQLEALTFSALTNDNLPDVGDRMPLSAKGTLTINSNRNGNVDLELIRCLAKVSILFKNITGGALSLQDCNITLQDMNPTSAYLFPPAATDWTGSYRTLTIGQTAELQIADTGTYTTQVGEDVLVFPSVFDPAHARYTCDVAFKVTRLGDDTTIRDYTGENRFKDLPVHNRDSQDIPALCRNQHLKIEIRIGNANDISFNFVVSDWDVKHTETLTFD